MKPYWILPSTLSVVLLASPAAAAKLQSWHFDASQNRLDFSTDAGVQPKAQLLFNPTRLVIDLPGTTLGHPMLTQPEGGAIRAVRVGQFDDQTTRIVIELSPGYTIEPQQVQFRGASPSQWSVQLPTPQPLTSDPSTRTALSLLTPDTSLANPSPPETVGTSRSSTQVENVRLTPDGFFIRTRGAGTPELQVSRSRDRTTVNVDIKGATLSSSLPTPEVPTNRYGVKRIQINQIQTAPPVVRMTLSVDKDSPNWQATVSNLGGVIVLPTSGIATATATPIARHSSPITQVVTATESAQFPQSGQLTTIQSVELAGNETQLVIRGDRSLTYTSGWDWSSGFYRITIANAQIARSVIGPTLDTNSPLLRVRLQQSDPRTVVILVQPAAAVRIGELNQPGRDLLSLQLQRDSVRVPSPDASNPPFPFPTPTTQTPPPELPRIPNGKIVVVVDPGHGGPDSGAVGLGGIQEKRIVLPIAQQVAALLEQQGVQAVLTRTGDYDVDLQPRVDIAQRVHASLFVSIHANSVDSRPDVNGLETYYFESGLRLAQTIHNSILQSIDIKDRGVRHARFYVLRKSSMPSVLVETGYVTGYEDSPRLGSSAYQSQMATAIANGILQYIHQNL